MLSTTVAARSGRFARIVIMFALVALALLLVACGSAATPSSSATSAGASSTLKSGVPVPDTPAGAQARWLIGATAHLPIPEGEVRAHFDAGFLGKVSPATLNQALKGAADMSVVSITTDEPRALVVIVAIGSEHGAQAQVSLAVDGGGLISSLLIGPVPAPTPAPPTSWEGVDAAIHSVAPDVHLLVGKITGNSFQDLHSIAPDTPAPLGSAFKLYVLDALGEAVAAGKVTWDQMLTVTSQLKSLSSGQLQDQPDGTRVSVKDVAAKMISISDNTAADMMIDLVGRPAIEAALTAAGIVDPSPDRPFLTTREMFTLKLDQWPTLAQQYVGADEAGRRELLAGTVDKAALPDLTAAAAWTAPRDIDSIEWFASANDLCRAFISLSALAGRPGLSPIAEVLSINGGSLQLDPAQWKATWFKGGSEPGVLALAYLATTQSGQSYMVAALTEDPTKAIDEATAIPVLLSAVKGAFILAAGKN